MKKSILLFTAFFMISVAGYSGNIKESAKEAEFTFSVSGMVLDTSTGEALAGVKVILEETDTHAYSDFDGKFVINGLTSGDYTLSASFISYESTFLTINSDIIEDQKEIKVKLDKITK
ncbi:MAG: carboxypeptidase-like regulatory domain-containing protein [Bacteroidetes bacterium]|nr:MAG: carboxypeptidase-like regulatory domain-containing protein [Bacteroidota bacterium]